MVAQKGAVRSLRSVMAVSLTRPMRMSMRMNSMGMMAVMKNTPPVDHTLGEVGSRFIGVRVRAAIMA